MGHFQPDLIADDKTDEPFAHFAGDVSEHFVTVTELYAEHGSGEHGTDETIKFNGFILVVRAFFAGADLWRGSTAETAATRAATTTSAATAAARTTATTSRSGTVMPATTLW
ncbi:MAG: hypothetical protein RL693_1354 [Verrucomicrobiota bacterium]|jgi:hypothetical protein